MPTLQDLHGQGIVTMGNRRQAFSLDTVADAPDDPLRPVNSAKFLVALGFWIWKLIDLLGGVTDLHFECKTWSGRMSMLVKRSLVIGLPVSPSKNSV